MANGTDGVISALASIPIGELVRSMAMAIADAQFELDKSSLIMAEFMSGHRPRRDPDTGQFLKDKDGTIVDDTRVHFGYTIDAEGKRDSNLLSMMELGFVPNFYQFVDTVIEVKLALRVNQVAPPIDPATGDVMAQAPAAHSWGAGGAGGNRAVVSSTPIDAGYSSAYSFNLELASVFKTKLVPVPPPAVLEDRLRELVRQGALPTLPPLATPPPEAPNTTEERKQ
jgi:hypothetical protein